LLTSESSFIKEGDKTKEPEESEELEEQHR
jgi:hypothetical protein